LPDNGGVAVTPPAVSIMSIGGLIMSQHPNYRLPAPVLDADRDALVALSRLGDFKPVNPDHTAEALGGLEAALTRAEHDELLAQKALAAARDATIEAGWEFHNTLIGAKAMVIGQYGNDSQAVQAIGLKKRSDRKRATRRRAEPVS